MNKKIKDIEDIKRDLINGDYIHSLHSATRVIERNISSVEIAEIAENAMIIEDYPDDKYSPSCLILGFTHVGIPLHLQVTKIKAFKLKIITIYQPDDKNWKNNFKERRK
jgi:hypothetical protein